MKEFIVEVTPGRELLYRTPLELRAAIRSGEITAQSRIFHRASWGWVPITEHPEYRKVQAELIPQAGLDSPRQPQLVLPPPGARKPGVLRGLAGIGALALSGWASIKTRLDFRSKKPIAPPKAGGASRQVGSMQHRPRATAPASRPAPQPAPLPPAPTPASETEPSRPGPARSRWTFYS